MEGKRTKQSEGPLITDNAKYGDNFKAAEKDIFIKSRLLMFSDIKQRIDAIYHKMDKPEITVTLKDGKQIKGQAFLTTPYMIAKGISKNLAEICIVGKVKYVKRYESPLNNQLSSAEAEDEHHEASEYELIDLTRPLEGDCLLELITFEEKEGKEVFWHSSAHLLGQSLQNNYGAWLCHGPPLDSGFFYDSFMGEYKISQMDYEKIEKQIKKFSQEKQPYERILLTKKEALEMFGYNPFKRQLIENKIPENGLTSAYRCGNLIDLCTGPHIPTAGLVKGFKVTKNSSAYWLGKKENDDLQRVYAISFPKQALLDEYVKAQQILAKRDHRNVGPKQDLFHFTTYSPGSALFYPHGTVIYSRLMDMMKGEYKIRGYNEVISPNIYSSELWKVSGHYFKYKDNIYWIKNEGEQFGLKPMNCPGHCVMFSLIQKSYKDLPYRMADFGVLHRNQLHGALSGLTRVRRFQQDDAHIFCRQDQIEDQILGVLDLLDYIYSVFDFKYVLELSTRPEKYLGAIEDWNVAEEQLKKALEKFGREYRVNEGDGAFYGPKIDVKLFDVFGREHQCGTCQLDFQLPQRFNLQYRGSGKNEEEGETKQEEDKQEKKVEKKEKGKKKGQKIEITPEERERLKQEKLKRKQEESKKKQQQEKALLEKAAEKRDEEINIPAETNLQELADEMAEEQKYNVIHPLKNGFERPVIIHRAIFGSMERFIAILCEQTGGKWDFWVSPRQLMIVPLTKAQFQLADAIENCLILKGFSVSIDKSGDKLEKKIRNAQIDGYNYIGVLGHKQVEDKTITMRKRDEADPFGTIKIKELIQLFESQQNPPKSKKRMQMEAKFDF